MSMNWRGDMSQVLGKMLTTLGEKVDPSHTALIVVDVTNDFCAEGGYLHKERGNLEPVQAMVPRLLDFIENAREVNLPIIYIQPIYNTKGNYYLSDVWLEQYLRTSKGAFTKYPVCEPNSWGADFYDGIKPLPGEIVLHKHRYSAFIDTDLDLILRSKGIRTLIMSGVASSGCVQTTAIDGFMMDYYIVFLSDCSATFDEELHIASLRQVDRLAGEVVNARDVVKCWER